MWNIKSVYTPKIPTNCSQLWHIITDLLSKNCKIYLKGFEYDRKTNDFDGACTKMTLKN